MKGLVIDVYNTEAYIAMPDGMNICVGLSHLPPNTKAGSKVGLPSNSVTMINHKQINEIL